jgi:hypothetical protein
MLLSDDFPMMMEVETDLREGSMTYGQPLPNCPPVAVSFGFHPVLDGKNSKGAGRQIYKDVEFVKIAVPGDRNSLYFQPAENSHRNRFPRAHAAFKARESTPLQGTPIEQWAPITRSLALNLKTAHIDTVEALAAVHDGNIDRIGANGRELREKARAWLADAQSGAASQQLAAEKQALQDQLKAQKAQMDAMEAQMAELLRSNAARAEPAAPVVPQVQRDPTADVEADVAIAARRPRGRPPLHSEA